MVRVAVDTRSLADGSQYRGIGRYVCCVLDGLARRGDVDVVGLAEAETLLPDGVERAAVSRRAGGRLGWWQHELLLPREVARAGADVLLSPGQHAPRTSTVPWVQTLFDVIPLTRSDPAMGLYRARWRRQLPRLRRAAAVIAISRATADDGIRLLGLDASRVHVVPLAPDAIFQPPAARPEPDPPYLLAVSAWGPHKGFAEAGALIDALAEAGYPHRLVIAGPRDAWSVAQVRRALAHVRSPERVDVVGYVDDLVAMYQGATALVSTSRAEGFGLPAVEAMACATPVVAFANTAQTEVIGDGGLLVADGDPAAMFEALRPLLDDESVWRQWSERARHRAATFDWQRTVDAHVEILTSVALG